MTRLTVLSGPTAVGKDTILERMTERFPDVWVSVSMTTRSLREGEVDGVDYFFVSEEEFSRMVDKGEFLEWATVHGSHRYGTPLGPLMERLDAGIPCLLELDLAGARQVRHVIPDALFVFIAPPSWEELVRRQEHRDTEDAEERQRRLLTARIEMDAQDEFDVVIINDDLDDAVERVHALVVGR